MPPVKKSATRRGAKAKSLFDDLESILISEEQLQKRLDQLARQITKDYTGRKLVLVGVLRGCLPFLADLTKRIPIPHSYDLVGASSYGASTTSSGRVLITKDIDVDIAGADVLITEDIYDTGNTLAKIRDLIMLHKPASVEVCALLWKEKKDRKREVPIKYVGFEIPDEFVVGYGLDFNEIYRNLPCIGVLRSEIYK